VGEAEFDPAIISLNEGIKQARTKLAAAQQAREEDWAAVNDELSEAVDTLRRDLSAARSDLP
jgi:hypothetical protein